MTYKVFIGSILPIFIMKVGNKSQKMACLSKDFVAKMEDISKQSTTNIA